MIRLDRRTEHIRWRPLLDRMNDIHIRHRHDVAHGVATPVYLNGRMLRLTLGDSLRQTILWPEAVRNLGP